MKERRTAGLALQTSEAARLLGKRSWRVRLKRFGMERLRQAAAEMGREYGGRPRLPDDHVSKAALYQRARRERLKRQSAKPARRDSGSKKGR